MHAHIFLDKEYLKVFQETVKGLRRGKHQIAVTGAMKDHDLVAATHTITIDVQESAAGMVRSSLLRKGLCCTKTASRTWHSQ